MGLDSLVRETCTVLEEDGVLISLVAAKATIQLARRIVQEPHERDQEELCSVISERLRARRVLMPLDSVRHVIQAYAQVIVSLDILEINEIG
jgi:predicted ATPase